MDELDDLDRALGAASQGKATESFGVHVMRESLLRRREEIIADAAGSLDLAIRGESEATSGGEISLVAHVLESLQESLASIAQVLAGEPTLRGLIPSAIKDSVELRVLAAQPGSLQLKLVPANPSIEPGDDQPTLLDADVEAETPLLDRSMDRLLDLISLGDEASDELLQGIADVGPRATGHIQRLSKALDEGDAKASLSWRSTSIEKSTTLTRASAKRLALTLDQVSEANREAIYTGRIVGGSLVHRRFELEPDGEDDSLIAGEVSEDALPALEALFGKQCTAHIDVREARLASGETRESHLLRLLTE